MAKATWQVYHNPRCMKSRAALEFLDELEIEPELVLYLKDPPSELDLKQLLKKLGMSAKQIIRRKEPILHELKVDWDDEASLIKLIAEHPVLLERPIIVHGSKAVVGRPTERINELL